MKKKLTPRAGLGFLRRKYLTARRFMREFRKLAVKEREWKVPLRSRQPRWWFKGFLSRSAVLYGLTKDNYGGYVSDMQRLFRTRMMVQPLLQDVINNKFTTHLVLRSMGVPSSELLGVLSKGAVHPFPKEDRVDISRFLRELPEHEAVFFKVFAGAEGKNIFAITRTSQTTFAVNDVEKSADQTANLLRNQRYPFVIEKGLEQHPDTSALYPKSVNTIRVLTMLDVDNGYEPFIAVAAQRIGSNESAPSDNWARGGLSAQVDIETGRLGRATRLPQEAEKEWLDEHPDTGSTITDTVVPHWEEAKELILHAAKVLSFMEYVGWDIVIGPEGPLVLEANINTGVNVLQSHQPLFADPRVRSYYARRGVRPGNYSGHARKDEEIQ